MNPLTNVKNINKINEIELQKGYVNKKSWHDMYKESAWIFIGGLPYDLTEGDVLSVFSQYGEIVNINLVRDKKTGKSKGFCFLCYANQKSTILAVDNLNGIKLLKRTIRVDHVANYKPPKDNENDDEISKQLKAEGCAPKSIKQEESSDPPVITLKKKEKSKKEKKKHKKKKKENRNGSDTVTDVKIKKEKIDPGYSKYENPPPVRRSSSVDSDSSSSSASEKPLSSMKRTLQKEDNRLSSRNDSNCSKTWTDKRIEKQQFWDDRPRHKSRHDSSEESESASVIARKGRRETDADYYSSHRKDSKSRKRMEHKRKSSASSDDDVHCRSRVHDSKRARLDSAPKTHFDPHDKDSHRNRDRRERSSSCESDLLCDDRHRRPRERLDEKGGHAGKSKPRDLGDKDSYKNRDRGHRFSGSEDDLPRGDKHRRSGPVEKDGHAGKSRHRPDDFDRNKHRKPEESVRYEKDYHSKDHKEGYRDRHSEKNSKRDFSRDAKER